MPWIPTSHRALSALLCVALAACGARAPDLDAGGEDATGSGALSCTIPATDDLSFGHCREYLEYPDHEIALARLRLECAGGTLGSGCLPENRAGRCQYTQPDPDGDWLVSVALYYPVERSVDDERHVAAERETCETSLRGAWLP